MKQILVVDDEPHIARLVKNILSKDYQVDDVNTAVNALEKTRIKKYDLIILDVMMPNMNGYELCEKLREDPDTYDTPVIFLTAKSSMKDKIEAVHVGGDDYIIKPFDPEDLLKKVEKIFEARDSNSYDE